MKKLQAIYTFVLLFTLFTMPISANNDKNKLPIACINIDYIIKHYTYAQFIKEELENKKMHQKY